MVRIEELLLLQISGRPVSVHTKNWLAKISDGLHERFVRNKLCSPKHGEPPKDLSLSKILGDYIARRVDLKDGTVQIYKQAKKHLIRFFGEQRDMNSITIGEAGDFRRDIRGRYSEAYLTLDTTQASLLFQVIAERYEKQQSIILTSNKAFSEWAGVFAGDAVMASAALDRLLHRATVINIRGESYRLKSRQHAGSERIEIADNQPASAMQTQGQPRRWRNKPAPAETAEVNT